MKKTILITLIIGLTVNVALNLFVPEDKLMWLGVVYFTVPLLWLGVAYSFKFKTGKNGAAQATFVVLPWIVLLFVSRCFGSNMDLFYHWMFRTPLLALLCSIIILEYEIYKYFR